jgi:hypothetical protein
MRRLIGCSYDWTTATFYRETVLRIETKFEDSMSQHPIGLMSQVGEAYGQQVE